ncbi:hypothetical protein [Streptomyces sp. A1136]|uniref:hypothetical protein n=1 Tax=Streptomyces sp. A1136 TaxID=2563102 RepID=UPI00109E9F1B|nr:hypothetical protein [Streptomyces sp. A1136]THA51438.1 hypothetical protein E6R62_23315 [Streptomyces sp. A1136]
MNRYAASQEPFDHADTAEPSGPGRPRPLSAASTAPHRRAGRPAAARHRKSRRSRWLVAGLGLASALTATLITLTVQPAAPAPGAGPSPQARR